MRLAGPRRLDRLLAFVAVPIALIALAVCAVVALVGPRAATDSPDTQGRTASTAPCTGDLSDPLVAEGCVPNPEIECMADQVQAEQQQARTGRKVTVKDIGDACETAQRLRDQAAAR